MRWLKRRELSSIPSPSPKEEYVAQVLSGNMPRLTGGANIVSLPVSHAAGQPIMSTINGTGAKAGMTPQPNWGGNSWSPSAPNIIGSGTPSLPVGAILPFPGSSHTHGVPQGWKPFPMPPYPQPPAAVWSLKDPEGGMVSVSIVNSDIHDCRIAVMRYLKNGQFMSESMSMMEEMQALANYLTQQLGGTVSAFLEIAPPTSPSSWKIRMHLDKQDRRAYVGLLNYAAYGKSPVHRYVEVLTRLSKKLNLGL